MLHAAPSETDPTSCVTYGAYCVGGFPLKVSSPVIAPPAVGR